MKEQVKFEDQVYRYARQFAEFVQEIEFDFQKQINDLKAELLIAQEKQEVKLDDKVVADNENRFARKFVKVSTTQQAFGDFTKILNDSIVSKEEGLKKIEDRKRDAVEQIDGVLHATVKKILGPGSAPGSAKIRVTPYYCDALKEEGKINPMERVWPQVQCYDNPIVAISSDNSPPCLFGFTNK